MSEEVLLVPENGVRDGTSTVSKEYLDETSTLARIWSQGRIPFSLPSPYLTPVKNFRSREERLLFFAPPWIGSKVRSKTANENF